MSDKKKEILSLDPFDVLSEVVTGEIFEMKRFTGIALPDTLSDDDKKKVKENGAEGSERESNDGKRSGGSDIRNPFKPTTNKENAGKAKEGRATSGNGTEQPEQSEQDKSGDDKSDKAK